ncbi:MAG: DUF1501 domain-containing protein [Planctomyces sp.]|nr:DUF1501 domain-containing protein [Planctomyces sp.]
MIWNPWDRRTPRRGFLDFASRGLGATALWQLLAREEGVRASDASGNEAPPQPRIRRAVQICLVGGLSHLDSFDYRPRLESHHGKSLQSDEQPDIFFGQVGLLRKSDWTFAQHGESGLWVSDLFPNIAGVADELTVIRSMVSDSANHTPALFVANSGFQFNSFPSMGSWLSYGLGNESDALPTFVVLPDGRGRPNGGASNWSNGFLPAQHQGVMFQDGSRPVRDLFPADAKAASADDDVRAFVSRMNRRRLDQAGGDQALSARIESYELAARMQSSIPAVSDLSQETAETQALYGIGDEATDDCGRKCLLARRLLERGVRFVQLYSGGPIGGTPRTSWDAHEDVRENHTAEAGRIDQPVAALVRDLKQRGLLDDTLVLFTTEFGRTPFTQSASDTVGTGRDHNRYGFSVWMAGGGLRPGLAFGSTDEIGWKAVEHPVPWHDFHATVLHLFGIDHTQLTYYHNGIQRRLTNVHGEVVRGVLA